MQGCFGANTTQSQIRGAQADLGICFVPMTQVARSLQSGALLAVLPHYQQETAGFYVVYPKHKQIPRSVAAFLNMTFARAAESAWL